MNAAPATTASAWQPGDRVIWDCVASGYGFSTKVAGVVREVSPKTALIEVAQRERGQWIRALKRVPLRKLSARTVPVAELGESLAGAPADIDKTPAEAAEAP